MIADQTWQSTNGLFEDWYVMLKISMSWEKNGKVKNARHKCFGKNTMNLLLQLYIGI